MRLSTSFGLIALTVSAFPVAADDTETVLRVTGRIESAPKEFSLADLQALPATTLETSTVVTDGTHLFTGVLAREFLEMLGAEGEVIMTTALNDYIVEIPASDFENYDVIIAYDMDGAALDRADKGPLWIIYPRDDHAELQDIRFDYRWVWQLSEIEVK